MSDPEITIDEIAESFAVRLQRGERPSIGEYQEKYPQLADRIAAVLPALLMLEGVASQPEAQKLAIDNSIPQVIGDYQIIQEVGRGGMGIVFEARHTKMRRRVALKVLPKNLAGNPDYVGRFLTEARSAGQLHHTNIVPVFEVGESEGLNFYAMQFIHGDNLDRVIADVKRLRALSQSKPGDRQPLPTNSPSVPKRKQTPNGAADVSLENSQNIAIGLVYGRQDNSTDFDNRTENQCFDADTLPFIHSHPVPTNKGSSETLGLSDSVFANDSVSISRSGSIYHRRVAAVGVQVADALEYAHQHHVLHRDVKPANLILDTEGNVWITDFGLAKFEEDLTQTGDVIGTLRYMAPERFNGEADGRSDVYSLGLTLYELCTLRCAFEGSDRASLIKNVHNRSPIRPRKIDATIPVDFETIILKAIEPETQRRYQTSEEMAEDLRLFLADRPVNARKIRFFERFYRVCRRNPIAASMSTCIFGLLVLLTLVSMRYAWVSASKAAAELDARKKNQLNLYESKIDQARLSRRSRHIGQRFDSIAAIREARELIRELEFSSEKNQREIVALRDQAIAAMTLTDVHNLQVIESDDNWGRGQRTAFDADYSRIAEGNLEGGVRVRFLKDPHRKPIYLTEQDAPCRVVKFSPNGRYVAFTYHSENALYRDVEFVVWDLESPEDPILEAEGIVDFDFDDQNQLLAYAFFGGDVDVFDLATNSEKASISQKMDIGPRFVRFGANGTQLAISETGEGRISIWSLDERPTRIRTLHAKDSVTALDWKSEHSVLAAGTRYGELCFWMRELAGKPQVVRAHQDEIARIHIHPIGAWVVSESVDSTIRLNNLIADQESLHFNGADGLLPSGFSDDGLLGHYDEQTHQTGIWEVAEPLIKVYPNGTPGFGGAIKYHPWNRNLIVRATDSKIQFWDSTKRRLIQQIEWNGLMDFKLSEDGDQLYCCGVQGIQRWSLDVDESNDELSVVVGPADPLFSEKTDRIALNHAGDMIIAGCMFKIVAIKLNNPTETLEFGKHVSINSLSVTADDRWLLSGTQRDNGVAVWDMNTGEQSRLLLPDEMGVSVTRHPRDNDQLVTVGNALRFWNMSSWKNDAYSELLQNENGLARFSEDGSMLAFNTRSSRLVVLNTSNRQQVAIINASESGRIVDFCFSPDGNQIALSCFENLQIVDLKKLRTELRSLNLDW